jgi:predicted DNA-binding transcriptional regulator AlpA
MSSTRRVAETVRLAGLDPTPRIREEIWMALTALAEAPVGQRTLTVLCALVQDKAVAAALGPLSLNGPHGALLDGEGAALRPSRFDTFELETLMATPSAVAPVLSALFHELEQSFDGRPVRGRTVMSFIVDGEPVEAGGRADRLLSWDRVHDLVGFSRSTAWRLQRAGDFPKPVQLSPGRVGWWESELTAWKASRNAGSAPFKVRKPARAPRLPGMARSAPTPGPPPEARAPASPALSRPEPTRKGRRKASAPEQIDFGF